MHSDDPRFRIAAARRMLARADCDSGVAGHVSERVAGEDAFWVSPFGYFDETTPDMVVKLGFGLERLEGEWETSPAVQFHAAIYREPFLESVRAALRPGGAVAVWSAAASEPLADALSSVFGDCEARPMPVRLQERDETYWLYLART